MIKKQLRSVDDASYRMLLELAVDAFFQGNDQGRLIMVNDKAVELTGYSRNELLGMSLNHLFSDSVLEESPLRFDRLEAGETVKTERDILRKDGHLVRVEMNSKKMPDGTYQSFFRDITRRTQAEKALAASEMRYRKLHETMMDGFVFTDMAGTIIDSNEVYRRMLGYTAEELRELTYFELTPARWHAIEFEIVTYQILLEGHSEVYEKEYIRKDGTIFPVELRTFLVCNEDGEKEGMWAIVRDITQRKQAEVLLRESEEKFRSIIESSPTAMYFYNVNEQQQLILTGANPAADRIIGIDHNTLKGLNILEAFPNLAGTHVPEMYLRVALWETGPQSFEIPYADERFSGYYFVHVFSTGHKSIAVDFIDISHRKMMEEALVRSEIEYRDTLNSLPDWIYVVDSAFRLLMVNASMDDVLRSSGTGNGLIGSVIGIENPFCSPDDMAGISEVFKSGNLIIRRHKISLGTREVFCELTMVPIRKEGEVAKVLVVIRDRSREREMEELKQRSADQKEMLLREIHHRVKNNLSIVISLVTFQLNDNNNPELKRALIDIQTRIRAMALIHEHLYRSENLDRIPLATYISSLGQMIVSTFSGQRIKLVLELEPIESTIETALPIGLMINEMLTNAFKYAFPGISDARILISLKKEEGDYCTVSVSDNGIGLPENYSMESSTSLGLYIIRLLTEQIDGTLKVDRLHGTCYSIRFRNFFRKAK